MRLVIENTPAEVGELVAAYVIKRINDFKPTATRPFILGLPTGSSPVLAYKVLCREFKAGKVSFQHVVTFNMDEYCALPRDHPESYHSFMWENLFRHIGEKLTMNALRPAAMPSTLCIPPFRTTLARRLLLRRHSAAECQHPRRERA